ncbi:unnamed protein product [marine sediment metagenome]|uniref:Uncharacterized protein n=1 Tax=marine sediment metagenome TaxID=412755 RepID=X0S5S3_9ZZZZ
MIKAISPAGTTYEFPKATTCYTHEIGGSKIDYHRIEYIKDGQYVWVANVPLDWLVYDSEELE